MELTVNELAKQLKAELIGEGSGLIRSVGPLGAANQAAVTFVTGDKFLNELKQSRAGAVLVVKPVVPDKIGATPQLVVKNVNAALIEALKIFAPKLQPAIPGVHPAAVVAQQVKLGKNVSIGPCAVIETGVEIGDNTIIASGCKIGQNTKIGVNTRLDSNVAVYHNCVIGNSCIILANTTIGSTGFGYYFIDGAHRLIPHNGIVVIEDFVEIGANCCVDRAKFGETRIGAGTKIDNLVQIAHNVIIGKCCLIAGQSGMGGSVKIGDGVVLAGAVGIIDNIEIGDAAIVGARSFVIKSIEPGMHVLGSPSIEHKEALRVWAGTQRLPKLMEQVKELSARVEKLETAKNNSGPGRS
ncbi:MAG: UDP-3-O-(3-hydroxymyristoyl)glucosamine N-acyltransferase [Sedimentisphaerales bacterium]